MTGRNDGSSSSEEEETLSDPGEGTSSGVRPEKKRKLNYRINQVPGRHIFGKRLMSRYKGGLATDTVYDVSINRGSCRGRLLSSLSRELSEMWARVLSAVRDDGAISNDLIRIHLSHRDLTKGDIKIPLQKVGDITPEDIMNRIATVLQSYDHLMAENILEISVGVIKFPRGNRGQAIINTQNLGEKRSLTLIENSDEKCLARAIAVSEAWDRKVKWEERGAPRVLLQKMTRNMWRSFVKPDSPKQTERAVELIKSTGLSLKESSSFAAIPKYEEVLKKNVVVISAGHGNKVVYPRELNSSWSGCYYVYYIPPTSDAPGHFHSVKSPQGLMAMDYFCKSCLEGYSGKHKHKCRATCEKCKSTDCVPPSEAVSRTCRRCWVDFSSDSCFDRHLTKDGKSQTVCEKFWQCRDCRAYFCTASVKRDCHKCDHYYCKTCQRQVRMGDHHCYQRSQPPKKRCEKFIFFDFESTQESGEHIPNLVVARRYDLKKTPCDFTEHVFRSPDVRSTFGSWLFSKENKGYTAVAHNMKG